MRARRWLTPLLAVTALLTRADLALAGGACDAFKWDVRHERSLFATRAENRDAGSAVASAPVIRLEHLYRLRLLPQGRVAFAAPAGRSTHREGARAGLVRVRIAVGGLYRIALSQRFWVDALESGRIVAPLDFTGVRACSAPHKILLYRLGAGALLLQLSGWASPQTELTVTRAPADTATPRR